MSRLRALDTLVVPAGLFFAVAVASAAPVVSRLTPPSNLFAAGHAEPIVARFLPGQRFDLQATIHPDAGQDLTSVIFSVDGRHVPGRVSLTPATSPGAAGATVATVRAFGSRSPGVHVLQVKAVQADGGTVTAQGNFEIVPLPVGVQKHRVKNLVIMIGDGMGIAHRTAARLMLYGASQGKVNGRLAMDDFPVTGIVITHSLNSIVTDSSPGASVYATGNKGNNSQQGVFPDDTLDLFDNPRVEAIGEYLSRARGMSLGLVTTADIFDATPGAFASHTQDRAAGTGIVDQYFDDRKLTGLRVLMGGGRKWFLPHGTPGSARAASSDYVLPADLVAGWGTAPGAIDPGRDLLAEFRAAGFPYVHDTASLAAAPVGDRLLGLFALSNMNVALDKIAGRRGGSSVAADHGFPDQPMLDEMTAKALAVLSRNRNGFVLMVEGASIDKQSHDMDSERWILDTIEFDRAVGVVKRFAVSRGDTLVIVTADHECGGVNIIGASRLTQAELQARAGSGGGAAALRDPVVGTYDAAGFPKYDIAADGYPVTTDIDHRMLIGYASGADRYEDWLTNPQPLRDSQQPLAGVPPQSTYPGTPLARDTAGGFLVTGQVPGTVAVHTASDIVLSALGPGAGEFTGVMDNTDVFFKAMRLVLGQTAPRAAGQ